MTKDHEKPHANPAPAQVERTLWDEILCRAPKKHGGLSLADLKRDVEIDDHWIPIDEFYKRLKTDPVKVSANFLVGLET